MVRRAAKIDANQQLVVDALRQIGCSVKSLAAVGQGCPDLLVGFRGQTYLVEVKNVRGKNQITELQKRWFAEWRGSPVIVARSVDEAVLGISGRGPQDS